MRRDAASIANGAELVSEVVVVGAGPLGIVTALELADSGLRVLLIESGGDGYEEAPQRLNEVAAGHDDYFHAAKEISVRRQVGGTSTLWGGRCVPFDPIDFEPRPVVPQSLWPVGYDDLTPFLQRACDWSVCGKAIFNAKDLPELAGSDMVPGLPDGDVRTTDLERWSLPTRFGAEYGKRLHEHPQIDLVTNLTVTGIVTSRDGTAVDHLVAKSLDGKAFAVRAREYVLATGGLEATRLLMASTSEHHPDGIGNHSGHLGRWYMAHVEARVAEIHLSTPPEQTIYSHELDADKVYVRRRFTFSREHQLAKGLSNAAVWIVNPELGDHTHRSGILSGVYLTLISPLGKFMLAEAIRQAGTKTTRPTTVRAHLANIVRDLIPSVKFAFSFTYARFFRKGRKAPGFFVGSKSNVYPLQYHGEHLPHWESRVELSDQLDELGLPRLTTHLHFSDEDLESVRTAMAEIDRHLREHGVGRLELLADDVEQAVSDYLKGTAGYHQTGTTRMSAFPEDGVVTGDLSVHGVPNLSIASTSVFPTSSQANPTFMGIAFSVRLADRLKTQLQS